MKRYERYKDSGGQWIGEIPEHWEVKKIKYIFSERSEKGHPNEPVLCATQKHGVIPQNMYENRVVVVNKGLDGLKFVKEGDFVISLRSFQGGIEYAHYQGIISAAYTILTPSGDVNSQYIKYLFKSHQFIELLKTCVTGIREGQNINYDILRKNSIMLPPLPEQYAIVHYLKDKTLKIDQYVAARERERELLESLKQSEIANVVTKGLNPNAPMKDSGIPWIGMIPEHWEVKRLKNYVHLITTASNSITKVGLENIESFTGRYRNTDSRYEGNGTKVNIGDLVYGKLRPYLCKAWIASFECNAVGDFYVFQIADENQMSTGYLHKIFLSPQFTAVCNASTYGARMPRVSSSFMMTLSIPVPPLSEQQTIVTYIDEKLSKIDRCLADLQTEIDYLKEFKQRLISDAVTGQICITNEIK